MTDALTDLCAEADTFVDGGRAHHGMLKSCHWFSNNIKNILIEALEKNPGYGLRVIGHSLGAGVAALVTTSFLNDEDLVKVAERSYTTHSSVVSATTDAKSNNNHLNVTTGPDHAFGAIHCYAYAPPACVTDHFNHGIYAKCISSVVLGYDIVPRVGIASVRDLHQQLSEYDWNSAFLDDLNKNEMVMATKRFHEKVSSSDAMHKAKAAAASVHSTVVKSAAFGMAKKWVGSWRSSSSNANANADADADADAKSVTNDEPGASGDSGHDENKIEVVVQLLPPGSIFHLVQNPDNGTWWLIHRPATSFSTIALHDDMIEHHLLAQYGIALDLAGRNMS
jgi:Lipase (class 3)